MVSLSGTRYANRCGPAMLEEAGIADGLVARDEREYLLHALRLISDDAARAEVTRRMQLLDLEALFFDRSSPREHDYSVALAYLLRHHDSITASGGGGRGSSGGARAPLRVPALCDAYKHGKPCTLGIE